MRDPITLRSGKHYTRLKDLGFSKDEIQGAVLDFSLRRTGDTEDGAHFALAITAAKNKRGTRSLPVLITAGNKAYVFTYRDSGFGAERAHAVARKIEGIVRRGRARAYREGYGGNRLHRRPPAPGRYLHTTRYPPHGCAVA